ncbi:hypothetical protein [Streptomyces sp. NPDC057617]
MAQQLSLLVAGVAPLPREGHRGPPIRQGGALDEGDALGARPAAHAATGS